MRAFSAAAVLLALAAAPPSSSSEDVVDYSSEADAVKYIEEYNEQSLRLYNKAVLASWSYNTNITSHNAQRSAEASDESAIYEAGAYVEASKFNTRNFSPEVRRRIGYIGSKTLPEEQRQELASVIGQMGKIYASSKACLPNRRRRKREAVVEDEEEEEEEEMEKENEVEEDGDGCLSLGELQKILGTSRDFNERAEIWESWRTAVGRRMKPLYERYVDLKNAAARENGHEDQGASWRSGYGDPSVFERQAAEMYSQLEPLYRELHAFVRGKLSQVYGEENVDRKGKLPANVLGDMWGRFWSPLYELMVPYPDKPSVDPSEEMKRQNYTVEKIFRTADDFYSGLGLPRVPSSFWALSMLRRPTDGREVQCHATAWDFYDGKDFRIKMCGTDFSFENMVTAFHEMGHIVYDMQYAHLPGVFRGGANSGFHEAIGELMAMAAATPRHLHKLGLMKELVEDDEQDINFLLSQSLITVSTLPFHLVNDLWRWRVFRGEVPSWGWNAEYWRLKGEIVGVRVPVMRGGEDLDPPTIFHIAQDYDMIRYFTRTILQFQFWESLCSISGHRGPLHRCDFSGSKEAGAALGKMLSLGNSVPWPDALETLTGEREMSARPILEFFKPLHKWLEEKNKENGDVPGWDGF